MIGVVLPYGTNFYFTGAIPRDIELIKRYGFDFIRFKVELKNSYDGEINFAARDAGTIARLCKENGLKMMLYSEQSSTIPDLVAHDHPLVGADGYKYPRGWFGVINYFDPVVQEVAKKAAKNFAQFAKQNPDLVEYIQYGNEWVMRAVLPGWRRPKFELFMASYERTYTSYDEHSKRAWIKFLESLPEEWKNKILKETGVISLDQVLLVKEYPASGFSPTYLAWHLFQGQSMGEFLKIMYDETKQLHPEAKVISCSYMPFTQTAKIGKSPPFGHNVEYWLKAGRCFDYLSISTYNNLQYEYPIIQDDDLMFLLFDTYSLEIKRSYGLKGITVSEVGANTFLVSEDGARYSIERSLVQSHYFSKPEGIAVSWWQDRPDCERMFEQWGGIVRYMNSSPKPSVYGVWLAKKVIEKAGDFEYEPFTYIVISRQLLDMDIVPARTIPHPSVLAARDVNLRVITDNIIASHGFDEKAKSLVVFDSAKISSADFIRKLREFNGVIVVPATIGVFGVDNDEERLLEARELLGLQRGALAKRERIKFKVVKAFGKFEVGEEYEFPYNEDVAEIHEKDLPEDAKVLAKFEDGSVAIYRISNKYVTAFIMDTAQSECVAYFNIKLAQTIAEKTKTLKGVRQIRGDDRLLVYPMGDTVAIFNSDIVDKEARLQTPHGEVSMPVRRKDMSCFKINDHGLVFATVTGKGDLKISGEKVISIKDDGLIVVFDEGKVEVRPYYNDEGYQLTGVRVNDLPLTRMDDDLSPIYIGNAILPLRVQAEKTERVKALASFVQSETLADGRGREFRKNVTLLPKPDKMWITYTVDNSVDSINIQILSFVKEKGWVTKKTWEIKTMEGTHKVPVEPHGGPLETIRLIAKPLGKDGKPVEANVSLTLDVEFNDRVLPAMSYIEKPGLDLGVLEDLVYIRILYPYCYERCRVKSIDVKAFSSGNWAPLKTLYVGENGQHINRLYRSESREYVRQ